MQAYGRGLLPSCCRCFWRRRSSLSRPGHSAVIWHDRGDAAALDLVAGPGGKDHEPGTDFTIHRGISRAELRRSLTSKTNTAPSGRSNSGEEAKSETAATRLLWAAGYVVDEDYYRPQIHVQGLTRLARGQEFVSNGDTVTGARLERETEGEESSTWSWYDNPFIGTREFNGLRVMMALVNNWDLKDVNNGASDTAADGSSTGSPIWAPRSAAPATASAAAKAS